MSAPGKIALSEARHALTECPAGRAGCIAEPALERLRIADLTTAIEGLPDELVRAVLDQLGVRMPVRAVRDRAGPVLLRRLQRASGPQAHTVAQLLVTPALVGFLSRGAPKAAESEKDFVVSMAEELAATWSPRLVDVVLAVVGEMDPELGQAAAATAEVQPASTAPARDPRSPTSRDEGDLPEQHPAKHEDDEPRPQRAADPRAPLGVRAGLLACAAASDFSALDRALLRVACQAFGDREAQPTLDAVGELISRDPLRCGPWFISGLVTTVSEGAAGRSDQASRTAPTRACEYARWVGRVLGYHELGDDDGLREVCVGASDLVERLVADPACSVVAGRVLVACLPDRPEVVARAFEALEPFPGFQDVAAAALDHCERSGPGEAEALLAALDAMLSRWSAFAGDVEERRAWESIASGVALVRARWRRRRNDFVGALNLLRATTAETLDRSGQGLLALERALAGAGMRKPEEVRFPATRVDAARMAERLRPVVREIEQASQLRPDDPVVRYLGAMVAMCVHEATAVTEFEAFRSAVGERDEWCEAVVAVDFHLALSQAEALEPGTDTMCGESMLAVIARGYTPSAEQVKRAVDAFDAHRSTIIPAFLDAVLDTAVEEPETLSSLCELARRGDADALDVAMRVGTRAGIPRRVRFEQLLAVVEGSARSADGRRLAQAVDAIDQILSRAQDDVLDTRWADMLANNEALREWIEPAHADLERLHTLRRLGRLDEAADLGRQLFFRSCCEDLSEFSPEALAELLDEIGGLDDVVSQVVEQRRQRQSSLQRRPARPVEVLFVGGDERQARAKGPVEESVAALFGSAVRVTWMFPGWSSNWSHAAQQVEGAYASSDVVVLMSLVRTQFGRRVRRSVSEAGLPWVACTGPGRQTMALAIGHAVDVVERLRLAPSDPPGRPPAVART